MAEVRQLTLNGGSQVAARVAVTVANGKVVEVANGTVVEVAAGTALAEEAPT